jgi:TRAP transporter TAXI family solute receptor
MPMFAAFLIVGWIPLSAAAFDLVLATGAPESFSYFAGRIACRVINRRLPDIDCMVRSSAGPLDNLTNLESGASDLALTDSRILQDAVKKTGYFQFLDIRYDDLRTLFPLYDVPIVLVVRKDAAISSLSQLKGKRINAGAPRTPQHLAVETIMAAKGWSSEDFSLFSELPTSQSQDTMAFCHGNVQAMVHIGVHPNPAVQQLLKLCDAEFVDLDDDDIQKLVRDHPAFLEIDIPAGTYPEQPRAVATFGTQALLVASTSLDDETVYRIVAALDTHRDRFQSAHPSLFERPAGPSKTEIGIPVHAGAEKYFSEK